MLDDVPQRRGQRRLGERMDEVGGIGDLASRRRAEEAAQLVAIGLAAMGRLVLEGAEPVEVALLGEHLLHACDPERADELVLEVAVADEEPGAAQRAVVRLVVGAAEEGAADVPQLPTSTRPLSRKPSPSGP